jgi:hypothetical protein
MQGVAKVTELDEYSSSPAENELPLLSLDTFDFALPLLEIALPLHSSQRESLESVNFFVEDELPCPSALLRFVGSSSLGFVKLPPSPLHADKKTPNTREIATTTHSS